MKTRRPSPRLVSMNRTTTETDVSIQCNLDGKGNFQIETGLKFLNHMLEQFSKHSLIDLKIEAKGDLDVDEHHIVEFNYRTEELPQDMTNLYLIFSLFFGVPILIVIIILIKRRP